MIYLRYEEPLPGRDINGALVTCNRSILISEEDAIKVSRQIYYNKNAHRTSEQLLDDFIVTHWATYEDVFSLKGGK